MVQKNAIERANRVIEILFAAEKLIRVEKNPNSEKLFLHSARGIHIICGKAVLGFIKYSLTGKRLAFVALGYEFKPGHNLFNELLVSAGLGHIPENSGNIALPLAKIAVRFCVVLFRHRKHRPLHDFVYIVVNVRDAFEPLFAVFIGSDGAKPVFIARNDGVTAEVRVSFSADGEVIEIALHRNFKLLAEFYETFFVIRDGKVFRFRNDLYRLFVALYLFYEQFKAFVVALFISPIERGEKLEVIEILSARKKRIIRFPSVSAAQRENKEIFALRAGKITKDMLVVRGVVRRI